MGDFFIGMLTKFIKTHLCLRQIEVVLYNLDDHILANLIEAMLGCRHLSQLRLCSKGVLDSSSNILSSHYANLSLSALLHFVYSSTCLSELSLLFFYGADTIKFDALITAIKR